MEDAQELQFFVIKRVFEGDWEALDSGDVVEIITTRGELRRVLRARLVSSSGGLDE